MGIMPPAVDEANNSLAVCNSSTVITFLTMGRFNSFAKSNTDCLVIPSKTPWSGVKIPESLTQNKLNDGRDRVLYQYIQYAKRKWPEEWQKHINAFNYKYFDPPLEDKVIQEKIKYNYFKYC